MTEAELIDAIKASEQRERDAHEARYQDGQRAMDASVCRWCGRKWLTTLRARPKAPKWIPEAGAYGHLICYQRAKESK
jgi:hypothetical protein